MPIQPGGFNTSRELLGILVPHLDTDEQKIKIEQYPAQDVDPMEPSQGKIRGIKITGGRKMMMLELVPILERLHHQKCETQ